MSILFFDKDHNGEISYYEIKSIIEKSFRNKRFIWKNIKDTILKFDTNRVGKLSYKEIL